MTPAVPALLAALLALSAGARAADLAASTLAVQAVAPTGDGRARVTECSGVLIAPDLVLTAGHCLDLVSGPAEVAAFAYRDGRPLPAPLRVAAFARRPGHVIGWRAIAGDPETRRAEIAADLALLRLTAPVAGVAAAIGGSPEGSATLAGVGAAGPGGRSGVMKRLALSDVRPAAGGGARIAFATASGAVCGGDSGGPAASADGRVWGVVAAVIRSRGGCGTRIVVTPIDPDGTEFRAMRAAVGR